MPYKDKAKQKEYDNLWQKKRHQENREKAFLLVGDKCARCGLDDKRVLEFDHIIPIKRRTTGVQSGHSLARDIANGKYEASLFQTLCANCHTIKTYYE